jgi:hypothetical protein
VWGQKAYSPNEAYFDHLANAFLHGRLYLAQPPATVDLTRHTGLWYVPFPPLASLLMLPWVAWRGVAGTNTVLFTALFGAANVAFVYRLLEALAARGWTRLGTGENLWLVLLFGLGSVHWYMSAVGSVWFISQICTVSFVALAAWSAAGSGSPWLAGTSLALAMLARPNVALAWPLLLGIAAARLQQDHGHVDQRRWLRWAVASAVPMALAVTGLLAYNHARFGSALDFGYLSDHVATKLVHDLHTYGQFHLHYAPKNLWAMWLALPVWEAGRACLVPDPEGMSLLLTTPALVYLVQARRASPLVAGAWIAVGLLLVPLILYYNTGWWQFGYRFSLDFMVPVMILLAVAAGERVSWPMRGLILAGVLVNAWGVAWWFDRLCSG